MNSKCEVKFCNEHKAWRLYRNGVDPVDGKNYQTKDEAVNAARRYCEETGDELSIYNKNGELSSRRKVGKEVVE